jgi:hypothetical protein
MENIRIRPSVALSALSALSLLSVSALGYMMGAGV